MNSDLKSKRDLYDVFISHASEDKAAFVDPLVEELTRRGLRVWYDRFAVKLGDRLTDTINQGLSKSRFGIVVLSKNFLAKEWPKRELSALFAREHDGRKIVLPVWHDVCEEDLLDQYPELADRVAVKSQMGLDEVADAICDVIDQAAKPSATRFRKIEDSERRLSAEKQRLEEIQRQQIHDALQELVSSGGQFHVGGIDVRLSADGNEIEAHLGDISPGTGYDLTQSGWLIDAYTSCRGRWPVTDLAAVALRIWNANRLEGFEQSDIRFRESP